MDPVYQITDIVPGLWIWRFPHPDWSPPDDGDRRVTSTCVATGGEVIVLDPLAPPADAAEIWARLDTQPPTSAMVIKPDHVRSICAFVERYRCHAYGPEVFQLDDLPTCEIEPMWYGDILPGGLVPLYDGRSRNEMPIWLPEHRTIVFADAFTALGGELQVWARPGMNRPCSRRCAPSSTCPSSGSSSRTVSRSTIAPNSNAPSSAHPSAATSEVWTARSSEEGALREIPEV